MRTISTKLPKEEHERLLDLCNEEGQSVSEFLRELIKGVCDSCEKPESKEESKPVSHAQIIEIDGVPMREIKKPQIVEI